MWVARVLRRPDEYKASRYKRATALQEASHGLYFLLGWHLASYWLPHF
jgi:hypothetical protein